MIRAGALGYVTKTIDTAELSRRSSGCAAGDAYFSPRLAAFVLQAFSAPERGAAAMPELDPLTPREREVLHHLARGYAYKQIAARLGISARTVESHVGAVLRKLQLTSRHEVSHWAAARGLIDGARRAGHAMTRAVGSLTGSPGPPPRARRPTGARAVGPAGATRPSGSPLLSGMRQRPGPRRRSCAVAGAGSLRLLRPLPDRWSSTPPPPPACAPWSPGCTARRTPSPTAANPA